MGLSQMRRAEAPGNNGNGQVDEKPPTRRAGLRRFVVLADWVEEIKEILGAVEEEEEESEADPNKNLN